MFIKFPPFKVLHFLIGFTLCVGLATEQINNHAVPHIEPEKPVIIYRVERTTLRAATEYEFES